MIRQSILKAVGEREIFGASRGEARGSGGLW
jgi:hypothetical protein